MDFKRVEEIYKSKNTIQVFHNGASVWIEDIHPQDGTVDISKGVNRSSIIFNVRPQELNEGDSMR